MRKEADLKGQEAPALCGGGQLFTCYPHLKPFMPTMISAGWRGGTRPGMDLCHLGWQSQGAGILPRAAAHAIITAASAEPATVRACGQSPSYRQKSPPWLSSWPSIVGLIKQLLQGQGHKGAATAHRDGARVAQWPCPSEGNGKREATSPEGTYRGRNVAAQRWDQGGGPVGSRGGAGWDTRNMRKGRGKAWRAGLVLLTPPERFPQISQTCWSCRSSRFWHFRRIPARASLPGSAPPDGENGKGRSAWGRSQDPGQRVPPQHNRATGSKVITPSAPQGWGGGDVSIPRPSPCPGTDFHNGAKLSLGARVHGHSPHAINGLTGHPGRPGETRSQATSNPSWKHATEKSLVAGELSALWGRLLAEGPGHSPPAMPRPGPVRDLEGLPASWCLQPWPVHQGSKRVPTLSFGVEISHPQCSGIGDLSPWQPLFGIS